MIERPFIAAVEQAAASEPSLLKSSSTRPQVKPPEPVGIVLQGVEEQKVDWLWRDRIPLGGMTILDGDPGNGKSLLTLELAARVSRGYPLPGEKDFTAAHGVVVLSAEDSLSHVIRPRLRAANADLRNILAVPYSPERPGQRTISKLPHDVPVLRDAIERVSAKLVIFDVLMSYLPPVLSSNKDQDMRFALAPLAQMADQLSVAVVLIRHLNKNSGVSAIHRGGGSVGIIGAARSGLLLAADPHSPEHRVLAVIKSNLGAPTASLTFKIQTDDGIPRIHWTGQSTHTADSLLAPIAVEDRGAHGEAVDFLREELREGPREATKVISLAKQQGISEKTLRRAKDSAGVKSCKDGEKWFWTLANMANGARS